MIMLGQLSLLMKAMHKKMSNVLQDKVGKWNSNDSSTDGGKEDKIDIENGCELCQMTKCKESKHSIFSKNWNISILCNLEYLKLLFSLAAIVTNFVIITIIICEVTTSKNSVHEDSLLQKHRTKFFDDLCVNFPSNSVVSSNNQMAGDNGRVFHCFHNTNYLRYLFEMMILSWRRRSQNLNYNQVLRSVNQGFVQRDLADNEQNSECPESSSGIKFRNLLNYIQPENNEIISTKTGLYMVYMQLGFISEKRCQSKPTAIEIKGNGQCVVRDIIQHKDGLLVYQPKFYTAFVRLTEGTSIRLIASDTSSIDSHWRTNVMGSVLIS